MVNWHKHRSVFADRRKCYYIQNMLINLHAYIIYIVLHSKIFLNRRCTATTPIAWLVLCVILEYLVLTLVCNWKIEGTKGTNIKLYKLYIQNVLRNFDKLYTLNHIRFYIFFPSSRLDWRNPWEFRNQKLFKILYSMYTLTYTGCSKIRTECTVWFCVRKSNSFLWQNCKLI